MLNHILFLLLWLACIILAATPSIGRWIYTQYLFFYQGIETYLASNPLHKRE